MASCSRGDGGQVPAGWLGWAVAHPLAKAEGEELLSGSNTVSLYTYLIKL